MKNYITLQLELILFNGTEDVIRTSPTSEDLGGGEGETPVLPPFFG